MAGETEPDDQDADSLLKLASLRLSGEELIQRHFHERNTSASSNEIAARSLEAFPIGARSIPELNGVLPRFLARHQERMQRNQSDGTNARSASAPEGAPCLISTESSGRSSADSASSPRDLWSSTLCANSLIPSTYDCDAEFPRLFKVYPCPNPEACGRSGKQEAECVFFHSPDEDRRRANYATYKPQMCRFIKEAGGCRKAERCPFAHNDYEMRYHPDRFGKETCRDFLRGICLRRYCTFRHEVREKVETAITQIDSMNEKELLHLVLKISEVKGRSLNEKLLRRFGHGKKHSGWRLEGFNPTGRDDQKVKFVAARVESLKKVLRLAGEKKWATSLKTSSLRDMMSSIRKVAEEVRERQRGDQLRGLAGAEMHRLIRAVFSSTNWSCHSQEGDSPFLVTPENQNGAVTALEKLLEMVLLSPSRV